MKNFRLLISPLVWRVARAVCPLTLEGRIPTNATSSFFSSEQSPFNKKAVLGQILRRSDVTWAQAITFPDVPPSRWDDPATSGGKLSKAIEISINDSSIFASSSEGAESALRRAELVVNHNVPTVSGIRLWHFSVRTSSQKPLNFSHEYVIAFQEAQDFQADFWSVKSGIPLNGKAIGNENGKTLYVQGYKWANPVETVFNTTFMDDIWHNFGIHLDYPKNLWEILYSTGNNPLQSQTRILSNNLSGKAPTTLGETHFGVQKKPIGANLTNYLTVGTQESGIHESLIFGGIWQENATNHCLTL